MDEKEKEAADKKAADEAAAAKESEGEDSEGEDAEDIEKKKQEDLDLDKELEEEEKHGKPDPEIARKEFQRREAKRKEEEGEDSEEAENDEDKPLTRADLREIEERQYKRAQTERAMEIAESLATSPKEAKLIFTKWSNRQFPPNLPLAQQLEEAYVITHRGKLIGERNEALRAARNKSNANKDGSGTQRDATEAGEPKLSDADKTGMQQAGFVWDGAKRLYKKSLQGGRSFLYKDPKTGRQWRQ